MLAITNYPGADLSAGNPVGLGPGGCTDRSLRPELRNVRIIAWKSHRAGPALTPSPPGRD